jgi:outer membrane murein-binding lipoprotein Lpp
MEKLAEQIRRTRFYEADTRGTQEVRQRMMLFSEFCRTKEGNPDTKHAYWGKFFDNFLIGDNSRVTARAGEYVSSIVANTTVPDTVRGSQLTQILRAFHKHGIELNPEVQRALKTIRASQLSKAQKQQQHAFANRRVMQLHDTIGAWPTLLETFEQRSLADFRAAMADLFNSHKLSSASCHYLGAISRCSDASLALLLLRLRSCMTFGFATAIRNGSLLTLPWASLSLYKDNEGVLATYQVIKVGAKEDRQPKRCCSLVLFHANPAVCPIIAMAHYVVLVAIENNGAVPETPWLAQTLATAQLKLRVTYKTLCSMAGLGVDQPKSLHLPRALAANYCTERGISPEHVRSLMNLVTKDIASNHYLTAKAEVMGNPALKVLAGFAVDSATTRVPWTAFLGAVPAALMNAVLPNSQDPVLNFMKRVAILSLALSDACPSFFRDRMDCVASLPEYKSLSARLNAHILKSKVSIASSDPRTLKRRVDLLEMDNTALQVELDATKDELERERERRKRPTAAVTTVSASSSSSSSSAQRVDPRTRIEAVIDHLVGGKCEDAFPVKVHAVLGCPGGVIEMLHELHEAHWPGPSFVIAKGTASGQTLVKLLKLYALVHRGLPLAELLARKDAYAATLTRRPDWMGFIHAASSRPELCPELAKVSTTTFGLFVATAMAPH